jgi:tellurite resistance protein TerC
MTGGLWPWFILASLLAVLFALDLFVFQRGGERDITVHRAAVLSAFWLVVALAFAGVVWAQKGGAAAGEYVAGYVVERSLSVDNVFVFAILMSAFAVPSALQMRLLFWGVAMAIVMRAVFIAAGAALLDAAHWVLYLFGAFLVVTAVKLLRHQGTEVHPERNPIVRLVGRLVPSVDRFHGTRIFIRRSGQRVATPMLAALVAVATTDVVFALDSIPAIFAITRDSYIVFAANAFAVLGLVPLYFLLAGGMARFTHLDTGLALVLAFVGAKMLLTDVWHVPIWLSLAIIVGIIGVTVLTSLLSDRRRSDAAGGDRLEAREGDAPATVLRVGP